MEFPKVSMRAGSVRDAVGNVRDANISGMMPGDVKQAVLQKLQVGTYYRLQSVSMEEAMNMKLVGIYTNMAVFEGKDGQKESFKYIELYKQFFQEKEKSYE